MTNSSVHDPGSIRIDQLRIAAPAVRALHGAGYVTLDQLAEVDERDLSKLHGIGPKALRQLQQAFRDAKLR